jgi:hypothetical protein
MSTRDEIAQWLKEKNRLNRWGMIAALDREKTNRLLLLGYIARFNSSSYLRPLSVSLDGSEQRTRLESILLDKPRLSFENADIVDSRGRLRMRVVGGSIVTQKLNNEQWFARKIEYLNPLQGPELLLDIKLPDTPVNVEAGGELVIDLKHSSDFLLTHVDDPLEQRRAGDLFKAYFESLDDSQRRYALGALKKGNSGNAYIEPESFTLRTQGEEGSSGSGAVLILTRMKGAGSGEVPGKGYRYLIAEGDSATVLYQYERFIVPALVDALEKSFAPGWKIIQDESGSPSSAKIVQGAKYFPEKKIFVPGPKNSYRVQCTLNGFSADLSNKARVEFSESETRGFVATLYIDFDARASYKFIQTTDIAINTALLLASGELRKQLYRDRPIHVAGRHEVNFGFNANGEFVREGLK